MGNSSSTAKRLAKTQGDSDAVVLQSASSASTNTVKASLPFESLKLATTSLLEMYQASATVITSSVTTDFMDDPKLVALVKEFFNGTVRMFELLLHLDRCLENVRQDHLILLSALSLSVDDDQSTSKMINGLERFVKFPGRFDEFLQNLQTAIDAHNKVMESMAKEKNVLKKLVHKRRHMSKAVDVMFGTMSGVFVIGSAVLVAIETANPDVVAELTPVAIAAVRLAWDAATAKQKVKEEMAKVQASAVDCMHRRSFYVVEVETLRLSVMSLTNEVFAIRRSGEDACWEGMDNVEFSRLVDEIRSRATELLTSVVELQKEIKEREVQIKGARGEVLDRISNASSTQSIVSDPLNNRDDHGEKSRQIVRDPASYQFDHDSSSADGEMCKQIISDPLP